MENQLNDLVEFHKIYGLEVHRTFTMPTPETAQLRVDLLNEETKELKEAYEANDPVACVDALCDILYVAFGAVVSFGAGEMIHEMFAEVHASNMSKLDANGQPIVNGRNGVNETDKAPYKILKGPNYFKPKLRQILARHTGIDYLEKGENTKKDTSEEDSQK